MSDLSTPRTIADLQSLEVRVTLTPTPSFNPTPIPNPQHRALAITLHTGGARRISTPRTIADLQSLEVRVTLTLTPTHRSDNFNEFIILLMGQHKYD